MGLIKGDRSVEIDAPIERCFEIAANIADAPEWQGSLKDVEVLERDADKRALVANTRRSAEPRKLTLMGDLDLLQGQPARLRHLARVRSVSLYSFMTSSRSCMVSSKSGS